MYKVIGYVLQALFAAAMFWGAGMSTSKLAIIVMAATGGAMLMLVLEHGLHDLLERDQNHRRLMDENKQGE